MLVCINSLLNCTRTKYGHGEGPTSAHRALLNPEPRRPSPLTGQPQERRKGGAPAWAGQPLGEGGVEGGGGHLHAVVVGALPIEVAAVVVDAAVIQWAEAHAFTSLELYTRCGISGSYGSSVTFWGAADVLCCG